MITWIKKVNQFERIPIVDAREKSIEQLKDIPAPFASKEVLERYKLVYRPPIEIEMTPALKDKMEIAKDVTTETFIIGQDEKRTRKSTKRKPSKNNPKLHKTAVEKV